MAASTITYGEQYFWVNDTLAQIGLHLIYIEGKAFVKQNKATYSLERFLAHIKEQTLGYFPGSIDLDLDTYLLENDIRRFLTESIVIVLKKLTEKDRKIITKEDLLLEQFSFEDDFVLDNIEKGGIEITFIKVFLLDLNDLIIGCL